MTIKNNYYLGFIIMLLVIMNLTLIVKIDSQHNAGKRFTYTDCVVLYKICSKNGWDKTKLINRIYEGKNTEFREFLLGK